MRIVLYVGGIPFDGDSIKTKSLGGSETAGWAMARELERLGHRVLVFSNGEPGTYEGVQYEAIGPMTEQAPLGASFEAYISMIQVDVLVIQRHLAAFVNQMPTKLNVWWTHDLAQTPYRGQLNGMMWNVDHILTVSEWHKKQVEDVYLTPPEFVTATTNGIYPEDFCKEHGTGFLDQVPVDFDPDGRTYAMFKAEAEAAPAEALEDMGPDPVQYMMKQIRVLTFTSRPERGLENLIKPGGIMEQLGPKFHLFVCHYEGVAPQMADYYQAMWRRCERLPNVTLLPPQSKRNLYRLMAHAWLHVYPSEFQETSCITAMETQAAGLPIICSRTGALPETLKDAGVDFVPLYEGRTDVKAFVKRIRWMAGNDIMYARLKSRCDGERYHWRLAAEQWNDLFQRLLAEKSENVANLARHYLRNEEVMGVYDLVRRGHKLPADVVDRMGIYAEWPFDQEKYRERYHSTYKRNYAEIEAVGKFHGGPNPPRADLVIERFKKHMKAGDRILDIGPAEGNLTLRVARACPEFTFVCVDIEPRNCEALRSNAADLGLKNVEIYEGDQFALPEEARGCAGILAAEVIEHVAHPVTMIQQLWDHCGGNPYLVVTVPWGPWEALGDHRDEDLGHLHGFEDQDLIDIFGHLREFRITNIGSLQKTAMGEAVGNYVTSCILGELGKQAAEGADPGLGEINYERKHRTQAPRQSVALCMIVRNAEDMIAKAIKSAWKICDRIVIGLDDTTDDGTREVLLRLARKFGPLFEIRDIPTPLEIGFDEARNLTIADVPEDFILWLDADETLIGQERAWKYLRVNCSGGYSIFQHHVSMEPAGIIRTDKPTRIFRNDRGARFYGVVHEHPETKINHGMGFVTMCSDLNIHHPSYENDEARFGRFMRNYPLMQREKQKHPDRKLGHLLLLRDNSFLARDFKVGRLRGPELEIIDSETGQVLSPEPSVLIQYLINESTEMWEKIKGHGHPEMIMEAIQYWSLINDTAERGFIFRTHVIGAVPPGVDDVPPSPYEIFGRFSTREDALAILELLAGAVIAPVEEAMKE